jgi:hypothetical protein
VGGDADAEEFSDLPWVEGIGEFVVLDEVRSERFEFFVPKVAQLPGH